MKQTSKRALITSGFLVLSIVLYNLLNFKIWLSIRSGLIIGFTIAWALAIAELNYDIKNRMRKIILKIKQLFFK